VSTALRKGLWCLVAGPDVVRIAPSLVLSEGEAAEGLRRLDAACAELAALPRASNA
jgi:acetylornithine/succinyldiaminopimelate/putrescine aminotransferase